MRLGLDDVLVARHPLERLSKVDVRAILVGDVEEADAVIESVPDDPGEALDPQPRLVACLTTADAAGSHADQRNRDPGLAQDDRLGRALGHGAAAPGRRQQRGAAAITAVVAAAVLTMKSRRLRWPFMMAP